MPNISDQFQPLVAAFVTRGQQMLADTELTVEQFTSLAQSIGAMYRSLQPTHFTVVDVSAQVNHTSLGFSFQALAGAPFIVAVNGSILASSKWSWNMEHRTLVLTDYTFPTNAVVELYTFWHGDEVPPQPLTL